MLPQRPRVLPSLSWLLFAAAVCSAQNFQEFATPAFAPYAIAAGSDGALWFTGSSGTIGRLTTAGVFSQVPVPATGFPLAIVSAGDGALWSQIGYDQVARVSTSGNVTEYSINDGALVLAMTIGPDGAIWLTNSGIGRLTTTGNFTQFSTGNYAPYGITTGADGNLWFSAINLTTGGAVIGRITTTGAFSTFALASGLAVKAGTIATGQDGAVWFAAEAGSGTAQASIGRITTSGAITMFGIPNATYYSFPSPSIAAGSDGALWFTGNGAIGHITTSGALSVYPFNGHATQITAGSDGGMWFTDPTDQTLWRVTPTAPVAAPPVISEITPSTIAVGSASTMLRILGSGLAGASSSSPCNNAPLTVTFNTINSLNILASTATEIDVTVPGSLLSIVGNYPVEVFVNQISGDSCQTLTAASPVHVVPLTTGILGVSTGSLSFATAPGVLPAPQQVQVTSTLGTLTYGVNVQYTSPTPANWVGVSTAGGTTNPDNAGSLTISATNVAENFPPGTYTAAVSLISGSQVVTVTVTLNIGAALNVPSVMVFGAVVGASAPASPQDPQTLVVGSTGAAVPFNYTITPYLGTGGPSVCANSSVAPPTHESSGWLLINGSPNFGSGVSGQSLVVSIQPAGLAPGTYVDTISFFTQGGFTTTQVYLVVENPLATFNFSYTTGAVMPALQTTQLATSSCGVSATTAALGYSSDQNWLTAYLSAVNNGGFFVTLAATPFGLAVGTYTGTVTVTDTSGEVWIYLCTLTVNSPSKTTTALTASPDPAVTGQPVTLIAVVTPSAAGGTITFYDGATSLGSEILSGGAATISLSFASGIHALTAAYSGNPTYPASTSPPVNLLVNGTQQATATSLSAVPSSQTSGNPVTLTATVTPSNATGTVMFLDGGTLVGSSSLSGGAATLSISTLSVGNHTLTAAYSGDANDAASNSAAVAVVITHANQPVILTGGIANAASFAAAPVAPGSLVAIFTSPLATQPASFTTATLPNSLAGVSVTFNSITAPMVQVVPVGANPFVSVQVPFEVLPAGQTSATVPVVITVNGVASAPVMTQIVASQPGIFTLSANGQGNAILVNLADDTIAAPVGTTAGAHPIPRGQSAFFYVTGLGALTPSVTDGSGVCPAASGLCNANAMPTVSVGGVAAKVAFAGQAAGYPGVMQINIAIPQGAPTGSAISLTVTSADGTVTSNAATIAVQ